MGIHGNGAEEKRVASSSPVNPQGCNLGSATHEWKSIELNQNTFLTVNSLIIIIPNLLVLWFTLDTYWLSLLPTYKKEEAKHLFFSFHASVLLFSLVNSLCECFYFYFYFSFVLFIYFSELGISNHLLYIYRYISSSWQSMELFGIFVKPI